MPTTRRAPRLLLASALSVFTTSCAADDVIININPQGDSVQFSVPWDSISESVDTVVVDGDTIILIVLDTVFAPTDTILIPIVDTVVQSDTVIQTIVDTVVVPDTVFQIVEDTMVDAVTGDTTFVLNTDTVIEFIEVLEMSTDTLFIVDTILEQLFDTIVLFDTIIETRTDTIVEYDTIILVDTLITPPPSLDFSVGTLSLEVGESRQIEITITNALGLPIPSPELTWISGSPSIASVNDGNVTGIAPGVASVFAIAAEAGLSATLPVMVADTASDIPPTTDGPVFLFHSDWSTLTGTSLSAILDSSKPIPWSASKTGDESFIVVDTAQQLGFPDGMLNVSEVQNKGSTVNPGSPRNGVRIDTTAATSPIPTPEVGESLYFRWYIRNTTPDEFINWGGDNSNHPIQDGGGGTGAINWEFVINSEGNGDWHPKLVAVQHGGQQSQFVLGPPDPPNGTFPLSKDSVYMFQVQVSRTYVDSIQLHSNVHVVRDGQEVLLYDDRDWHVMARSLSTTLADNVNLKSGAPNSFRGLQWGSNGWSTPDSAGVYTAWFKGGLAICSGDWCGPYNGR